MASEKESKPDIFNCGNLLVYDILQSKSVESIKALFKRGKLITFDEAQTVPDIGLILKLLHDDGGNRMIFWFKALTRELSI